MFLLWGRNNFQNIYKVVNHFLLVLGLLDSLSGLSVTFNLTNHELRVSSQNFYPGRCNFKKEKAKQTNKQKKTEQKTKELTIDAMNTLVHGDP